MPTCWPFSDATGLVATIVASALFGTCWWPMAVSPSGTLSDWSGSTVHILFVSGRPVLRSCLWLLC